MSDSKTAPWYSYTRPAIAVIVGAMAVGGWAYVQDWRVSALEAKIAEHSRTPLRLQKLETVQGYIRNDIKGVKRSVENNASIIRETNRLIQGLDNRLDKVYGSASR